MIAVPYIIGNPYIDADFQSFQAASGAAQIGYNEGGAGAVTRTVQSKLQESVSVLDFGADPTGVADSTTAFTNAMGSGNVRVNIPPGTYILNNLSPVSNVVFQGSGYNNTFIQQKLPGAYAMNFISTTGGNQLIGNSLLDVCFIGATSATVACVNVEANGAGAVFYSTFRFVAKNCYAPIRVHCSDANAVFNCEFWILANVFSGPIVTAGLYNRWTVFATNTNLNTGVYQGLQDTSSDSVFFSAVLDSGMIFNGPNNTIINAKVEYWNGAQSTSNAAITNGGDGNVFISPAVVNVNPSYAGYAFNVNSNRCTLIQPCIKGSVWPSYVMGMPAGSSGTIINAESVGGFTLDTYESAQTLSAWQFVGNCSGFIATPTGSITRPYSKVTPTTGQSITIPNNCASYIIQPASLLATLAVTMPPNPIDGQQVRISAADFGITTLTVSANSGQTIHRAPTSIAAGASVEFIYSSSGATWYPG
jgi:hypothetical protein